MHNHTIFITTATFQSIIYKNRDLKIMYYFSIETYFFHISAYLIQDCSTYSGRAGDPHTDECRFESHHCRPSRLAHIVPVLQMIV